MFEFKTIVPVLKVSDMQKSVDFYAGVLGFAIAWRAVDDSGADTCMLQAGGANILLSTGAHLGDKPQFTGTLYLHMDGIEQFFDRIKDIVEVLWPLKTMAYGRLEFGIRDGNGYTLAFAEPLDQ
jgi:catechol 2,3-dioxygenase-like lactoylglutathione lyase family enzyme